MKRELCKFLSGAVAGLAYAHVAYAVAVSRGILNEPRLSWEEVDDGIPLG
jgi:hypothetical protein